MRQSQEKQRLVSYTLWLLPPKKKKKKLQPRLRCSCQMWRLCGLHSEATGTTLVFLRRADGRHLENDTNSNVWPKGNSDDKDTRAVFIFQDQKSCWVLSSKERQWPGWHRLWCICPEGPGLVLAAQAQGCHCPPSEACLALGSHPSKRLSGVSCDEHSADQNPQWLLASFQSCKGQDQRFYQVTRCYFDTSSLQRKL